MNREYNCGIITSSTFVLLLVGVVWKVNGTPPTSTPQGVKTVGEIKLKISNIN